MDSDAADNVASAPGYKDGASTLKEILSKLGHLHLAQRLVAKDGAVEVHGAYCDVFVGHVSLAHLSHRRTMSTKDGQVKVAIKTLRVILKKNITFAKTLAREIGIWSTLDHPNILPFLGYMIEEDHPSLISEWIDNGTIRQFVKESPNCDILRLAVGIAEGLKYLHDRGVVHSDLKPDNVLVSRDGEPLICDFGISRMLDSSQSNFVSTTHGLSVKGTIRYMAIELLNDGAKHNKETDVWAYGMILYELVSKQWPFAHLRFDGQIVLAIAKGELPNFPAACPSLPSEVFSTCRSICSSCWAKGPEERPTMSKIISLLSIAETLALMIESMASSWSLDASSPNTLVATAESRRTLDKVDYFTMPSPSVASSCQTHLLDTDIETSTVEVVGSHIRDNDKGKEDLSFVIAIHVIGKDSWQIEKLYSDVLALDRRLQTMCSRSTLEKLEPLPGSKLFKDHAPAKVDKRKRMLQVYLQSVMRLPIKDKSEIIGFFSFDVAPKRYKEGHLTKRGKKLGGWKTRYFVLQGSVLEYYESRGGAHLGSIQITGAQIDRLQETGSENNSDDEDGFRHALFIVEQGRGPAAKNKRHVLCAESDNERDEWVDVLACYVTDTHVECETSTASSATPATSPIQYNTLQFGVSTNSLNHNDPTAGPARLIMSEDLTTSPVSPTEMPIDKESFRSQPIVGGSGTGSIERISAEDRPQPSSMPVTSILSGAPPTPAPVNGARPKPTRQPRSWFSYTDESFL